MTPYTPRKCSSAEMVLEPITDSAVEPEARHAVA